MNTFVYTQTSAFMTHLLAHIPVTADIALDLLTASSLCPYLTKSNISGSTLTPSPPVEKFLIIVFLKQFQLLNFLRPLTFFSWKLTVYRSIVLSILAYAMDSALLSPSQIQKMNTVHFQSLRRVFKIKSSFCHRVLETHQRGLFQRIFGWFSIRHQTHSYSLAIVLPATPSAIRSPLSTYRYT